MRSEHKTRLPSPNGERNGHERAPSGGGLPIRYGGDSLPSDTCVRLADPEVGSEACFNFVAVNQDSLTGFALFFIGRELDATRSDEVRVLDFPIDASQGDLQIASRQLHTRNVRPRRNATLE